MSTPRKQFHKGPIKTHTHTHTNGPLLQLCNVGYDFHSMDMQFQIQDLLKRKLALSLRIKQPRRNPESRQQKDGMSYWIHRYYEEKTRRELFKALY